VTVTRCAGPTCSATAPAIVAADRWASVVFRGRRWPVCSQDCAAAVIGELVTVGGLPRRPAPAGSGPFDVEAERLPAVMPSERQDGWAAMRRHDGTVVRR
jgi:hypothetical protein